MADGKGVEGAVPDILRRRAEARVQAAGALDERPDWPEDARRAVHELRVHQVELEMQNEELRRVEAERSSFEDLYDFAPGGYLILDEGGVIRAANLMAARMLGVRPGDLTGRSLESWVVPEDRDLAYLGRQRLRDATGADAAEFRLARGGREPLWVRMEGSRAEEPDGSGEQRVLLLDITSRRQAERLAREREEQQKHLQRMEGIGRLAAGVAHEMNNILAAILAITDLMAEGEGNPQANGEIIASACRRGRELTLGLMAFARRNGGPRAVVDLNRMVEEAAAQARAADQGRVQVDLDLEPGRPRVLAEAAGLATILANLCGNALDAMPGGGRLLLRTQDGGPGWVRLAVQDTGEGMAPEVAAKAAEPFFTTKPVGQGAGLGLAIAHGLVASYNGRLTLRSAPGRGTEVEVLLPALPSSAPVPAVPKPRPGPPCLALLVVDDDAIVRETLPPMLARAGHRVRTAASGPEALDEVASGAPLDAVVLDIRMPGMDGLQVLARLRGRGDTVPVLLFSGCLDPAARREAASYSRTGVLGKPASLAEFQEALGALMAKAGPS